MSDRIYHVETKNGFYQFRDDYHLPEEPRITEAVESYQAAIDRAYAQKWPLHPSMAGNRDWNKLVNDWLWLDFRNLERKRIQSMMSSDTDMFSLIDDFVNKVLLANLDIYQKARTFAIFFISSISTVITGFSCLFLLLLQLPRAWDEGNWVSFFWAASIFVVALVVMIFVQYWFRTIMEQRRENYVAAVRSSAGVLVQNLSNRTTEINNSAHEITKFLTDMGNFSDDRAQAAEKYVRLLIWNPERVGFYETYYRASIDLFVKLSARASLRRRLWANIMLWAAVLAMIGGVAFAFIFLDNFSALLVSLAILVSSLVTVRTLYRYVFDPRSPLSSNVDEEIRLIMEGRRWTRFSDLEVHKRIANVFASIYRAWLHEARKGKLS